MSFSFRWNEESTIVLLELCAKFRAKNTRCQQFKWKEILVNFEERVGKEVSIQVLRNKIAVMKKDYNLWMDLKGTETGLRFNPITGQILADPNWWENKIKENCEFKKFRYKGISPAIERLCACIFEDSYATNEDQSSDSMEERCVELLIAMRVNIERMLDLILKLHNRVEDALAVLYRMVDGGLLQRSGNLFCFCVSELLNEETRRSFMKMEDDRQRKAWLESDYARRYNGLP